MEIDRRVQPNIARGDDKSNDRYVRLMDMKD